MQEQRFSLNEVLKRFQTETEGNGLILDADLTMRVHVSIYHPYRLDASGQPNSELGCDPDDIVVEFHLPPEDEAKRSPAFAATLEYLNEPEKPIIINQFVETAGIDPDNKLWTAKEME